MGSRNGWKRVKFGDVVENVNVTVGEAHRESIERIVGLEHLDPGELAITRWGSIHEGTTFTRRFAAGQVLFGKRRAYQRKAAVAEFDGVCSGDIYVFQPKDGQLLGELLPFVVQSEPFFEHALRTSAGSLSPRTNWRDLKDFEFELPPIGEQREIAEVLWAAEVLLRRLASTADRAARAIATLVQEQAWNISDSAVALGDVLLSVHYGSSKRASSEKSPGDSGVLRIPNVVRGELDLSDMKWASFTPSERAKFAVRDGDVLIVRTNGNPDYVGRGLVVDALPSDEFVFASYLMRLRANPERLDPAFLSLLLDVPAFRASIRKSIRSSAGNYNLNVPGVKSQWIPLPSIMDQRRLVELSQQMYGSLDTIKSQQDRTRVLKRALVIGLLRNA